MVIYAVEADEEVDGQAYDDQEADTSSPQRVECWLTLVGQLYWRAKHVAISDRFSYTFHEFHSWWSLLFELFVYF